ncbi:MAG: bifunctional glutamine synthetase adenylyltransferase/deadenyltransferase [Gammaproteobacteria bacterium RIFOXYA12_FULL_61_12]|nr:MAG: bifunctional glutamine synthetase adenylyltransferase/deadenyltransferase [Gammaproteobacteria bacterium RIFOXYA12_FULL_61_12]OGT91734.1 MAG: bifunctional glutamine synthetase adenylyltransferase/deadenyltransferase [Gammaproteobacteria bacterium RIFOXYD12_FULL_61_37]
MAVETAQGLEARVEIQYQSWRERAAEAGLNAGLDEDFLVALRRVFEGSDYVAQALLRQPELLSQGHATGFLRDPLPEAGMDRLLRASLEGVVDEAGLQRELRRFRKRHMIRIIWRDLAGWAGLGETLEDLSALADACIGLALERLYAQLIPQYGEPIGAESGQPQGLVVLGLGKLGARELNLSSDVDLIFAFEEPGKTNGRKSVANEEFFTRLIQKLVQALDNMTGDGFVFRTDTRLRPYGDAGPLACSFGFMEEYYFSQAREWERYAMIKARVVAGDPLAGERLMAVLRPFTYRRYLDFGSIESLRDMKRMIAAELHKKGMDANIKLGPGGIREIEFLGQAFQLIRGGREPDLQIRPILQVLQRLGEKGLLPPLAVEELTAAYCFLRLVENRLQAWRDEQTHRLPADDEGRLRLSRSMGFGTWASFGEVLGEHRAKVQGHFDQIFAAQGQVTGGKEANAMLTALWRGGLERERASALLEQLGYRGGEAPLDAVQRLRDSAAVRRQEAKGQSRMDLLVPLVMEAAAGVGDPDGVLLRLLGLLEVIAGRAAYLALLVESPVALSHLVKLAGESLWIVHSLSNQPLLLDELLDPRRLYSPLHRAGLEQELRVLLQPVVMDDLEQQMERLRQFAQSNMLRVAAADITGVIPLMVVSDYLTEIAEVVTVQVLAYSWLELTRKHGRPACILGESSGFAVIGYGKLGGIELGYGSDLDLVFLHGSKDLNAMTDGERPVPNDVFYARLGQRMVHMFNTRTPSGLLYSVDMRLRPNGNAGLLVSSLDAFERYQKNEAWTWEHQALVRARAVAGDPLVIAEFGRIRREVLLIERDPGKLRADVREMREKMRESLDKGSDGTFDIKQGRGGIADIEFMVQFAVLRWAHLYPDLSVWTDNVRLLETLARHQLLAGQAAQQLTGAYKALRAMNHRHAIQERPGLIASGELQDERRVVTEIWRTMMEDE